ncbi:MAG: PaaI family thioesterase [Actinomycetota bacterium]
MTGRDAGIEGPVAGRIDEAVRNQELIFKDTFPGLLGVRILHANPEGASGEMEVAPGVRHPGGYAHGGAIAGFGDTIAAWATMATLEPGEWFTTIEFKCNFVAGVPAGALSGTGTVVHRGRRTVVVEIRITQGERLVAVMIVTQAVLRSEGGGPAVEGPPE